MNRITILRNPAQAYWNKIVEHAFVKEGWVNSIHDYKALIKGFPNEKFVFSVAIDSETRNFVGCVGVGTYVKPEPLSAIGMYLVKDEFQGKGIGTKLFDAAIKECAPKKFLYGVEKLMPLYRDKYGFNKMPDWYLSEAHSKVSNIKPLQLNHDPSLKIKLPEECGWNEIAKYYQTFLPQLDGSQLIKALLCEPQSYSGVAVTNDNKIAAIARVRETFDKELFIGPLLGSDPIAASTTLRHVLSKIPNLQNFEMIKVVFPNTNTDILEFMRQLTNGNYIVAESKCYPQFTHEAFELPVHQIYAVSQGYISIV